MTRDQLHIAFKIAMDKNSKSVAFGGCPAFLPEEIDYWLNLAMFNVVSTKFTGHNTLQQAFEGSVKRTQDLERLVVTDTGLNIVSEASNNRLTFENLLNNSTTNNGRMFFIEAVLNWSTNSTDIIKRPTAATVRLVEHETAKRFLETYNNKPWIDTPVATIQDNTLFIYVDRVTMPAPFKLDLTYVKYPTKVEDLPAAGMTEIPEYMQYEIVDKAVSLALEDIESRRVETKTQLNTVNE